MIVDDDSPGLRRNRWAQRDRRPPVKLPPDDADALPVVTYTPVRCPSCRSRYPITYGQYQRTRYHRCKACSCRFLSQETEEVDA